MQTPAGGGHSFTALHHSGFSCISRVGRWLPRSVHRHPEAPSVCDGSEAQSRSQELRPRQSWCASGPRLAARFRLHVPPNIGVQLTPLARPLTWARFTQPNCYGLAPVLTFPQGYRFLAHSGELEPIEVGRTQFGLVGGVCAAASPALHATSGAANA